MCCLALCLRRCHAGASATAAQSGCTRSELVTKESVEHCFPGPIAMGPLLHA